MLLGAFGVSHEQHSLTALPPKGRAAQVAVGFGTEEIGITFEAGVPRLRDIVKFMG